MPVIRSVWMVAMKLSPDAMEEKPAMNTPSAARSTLPLENMVE